MAVWRIAKLGRVSSLTGGPFPPDRVVVTALFGEEEETGEDKVKGTGFTRRDYLEEEATPERMDGAFCAWHTRTPPEQPAARRPLDLAMAKEFLQRLLDEGATERAPVCLTLGLLLMRKRRLRLVEQGDGWLSVCWPGEKQPFRLPAPELTEADTEALEQEIQRLFEF